MLFIDDKGKVGIYLEPVQPSDWLRALAGLILSNYCNMVSNNGKKYFD